MPTLPDLLARLPVASPFDFPLASRRCLALDLSAGNARLRDLDAADPHAFQAWLDRELRDGGAAYAAGGYAEDRALYRASEVFAAPSGEHRTVHLAIDLWQPAGTPVHAVLPGSVHSVRDNAAFGDYGPTVILEHHAEGVTFFTLYGHLSRATLRHSPRGRGVRAGEMIGWLGGPTVNGGWAPHLHFQVIQDMSGRDGDHPGVCAASEQAAWLERCPDPNLLLRIPALR